MGGISTPCEPVGRGRLWHVRVVERGPEAVLVEISSHEVNLLVNALNEVLHGPEAVEDWEFSTRLGVAKEATESLLQALSTAG
jgi:hypothetical protein